CLAAIRSVTGSLDEIARIVKMTGYVASAEGFNAQPQVINGASLLLEEIFGETGKHARAALGLAELPGGAPVEVELIVEVR
ncbi:MAG TPA: RidA family protein, partial [Ktedonobacteraceae bacterium]